MGAPSDDDSGSRGRGDSSGTGGGSDGGGGGGSSGSGGSEEGGEGLQQYILKRTYTEAANSLHTFAFPAALLEVRLLQHHLSHKRLSRSAAVHTMAWLTVC